MTKVKVITTEKRCEKLFESLDWLKRNEKRVNFDCGKAKEKLLTKIKCSQIINLIFLLSCQFTFMYYRKTHQHRIQMKKIKF